MSRGVYYNEHDHFAAAWLRELIADGLIPAGDVDERDVQLVQPADLAGYVACHFFAGIGGWPLALDLAGWPADRPVWTGSCPCQPFSSAGKGEGFEDPRHLWPTWFRLIRECRPPVVFGEQVAGPDGLRWLDSVSTDLEAEGYAFGACDLPAAGAGAPHRRQRLFFVAHAEHAERRQIHGSIQDGRHGAHDRRPEALHDARARGAVRSVADSGGTRATRLPEPDAQGPRGRRATESRDGGGMVYADGPGRSLGAGRAEAARHGRDGTIEASEAHVLADDDSERRRRDVVRRDPWRNVRWLPCRDGKLRPAPIEPALFPLAYGVRNRVGTLRGAGNAIVPQVAAEFVAAFLEAEGVTP